MSHYRLSKAADQDLERILEFGIDEFGPDQALLYYENLEKRFDKIAENPLMYPPVDHVRSGYRRSVCGAHAIYFRLVDGTVEIMRLIYREDLKGAF